jgi:hypothetical protein
VSNASRRLRRAASDQCETSFADLVSSGHDRCVVRSTTFALALVLVGCSYDVDAYRTTAAAPGGPDGGSSVDAPLDEGAVDATSETEPDTDVPTEDAAPDQDAAPDGNDGAPDGGHDVLDPKARCESLSIPAERRLWVETPGRCYWIAPGPKRAGGDPADNACRANGGRIVSFTGAAEEAHVAILANAISEDLWIGLRMPASGPPRHEWIDGDTSTYRNWGGGQPEAGRDKACVVRLKAGFWQSRACSDEFFVACEG